MAENKLRIAIIGGSMGGCLLALGLHIQQFPNITFDIYEAWTFSERGAGIGLHPNGQNAIKEMGIDVDAMLEAAGAHREEHAGAVVAYGEHEGKELMRLPVGIQAALRTRLLAEMVQLLPPERLHAQKKVVEVLEGEVFTLKFEDGSSVEADAIVGCDGLRSTVRKFVLGHEHPAVSPRFTGYWDARAFMSSEQAQEAFGTDIVQYDNPGEWFEVGESCTLLFGSAPRGKFGGVIAAGVATEEEHDMIDNPKIRITREFLEKKFGNWGKPYVKGVIDSILNPEWGPGTLFGEYEAQDAPTWYRGRMCIMGDAAHAALPWMGQGLSMAAEDAAVLTALFGSVETRQDIEPAFAAFDKVRRGPGSRSDLVIKGGRPVAMLCTGQNGFDPKITNQGVEEVHALFAKIWQGDIKQEIRDALEAFHDIRSK